MIDHQREITQTVRGINKLNDVIDWELFRPELESLLGYDNRDLSKGGRPPFDPVFMLKVLVLQKYHYLSNEQSELQIGDRFSFLQFLGLQPGNSVPDEKTILDFKGLLDKDGRDGARKLFEYLIDDEDETEFADSAHRSKSSDERLLKNDCQNFIQFKAQRGHLLTAEEIATNKLRSRTQLRC